VGKWREDGKPPHDCRTYRINGLHEIRIAQKNTNNNNNNTAVVSRNLLFEEDAGIRTHDLPDLRFALLLDDEELAFVLRQFRSLHRLGSGSTAEDDDAVNGRTGTETFLTGIGDQYDLDELVAFAEEEF
jgi:hypothetical protein